MRKIIFLILILSLPFCIFSKKKKIEDKNIKYFLNKTIKELTVEKIKNEKKLQFGFGLLINSNDIKTGIENQQRKKAIINGFDYSYPGITKKQMDSIEELDAWMQKSILASFIFRNVEYGIHFRLMWSALMTETDLTFTPTDYSDNNKTNFSISPMLGVRFPYFIMPYILIGPNMTLSMNPTVHTTEDNWADKVWAVRNSMNITPGIRFKTGVDAKLKRFSVGLYYQYEIKDFKDMTYWYSLYNEGEITGRDAFLKSLSQQSRFGISLSCYVFSKNKSNKK